ncbi:PREDICTED: rop guanine nucleotide exchange factor 10-like isoform X2 [Tarenaya hassleriana]|nr:PREDICTED: rop guanine nucleotide exchange factor 10-like isoform X2 [Tarenaya hassleriana]
MLDARNIVGNSSFSSHANGSGLPEKTTSGNITIQPSDRNPNEGKQSITSDMETMKEKFAVLLLGGDMTGGVKGVSSAFALSNAITNLAASVFGEEMKLEPMYPGTKARWRKEMDWLLSVSDHIVHLVPSKQVTKNGGFTEIMVAKQRDDLQMNVPALRQLDSVLIETLENFKDQNEFWYASRDVEEAENGRDWRRDGKWWVPVARVPPNGLCEETRRWLHYQKDAVTQVLKAAMAINAHVLSEMEIPESYVESLPKNGKTSLGDFLYKSITEDYFDPEYFLSSLDLSNEHKMLDLKNRIEASILIWKRKMHQKEKEGKSSWGSTVSLEKRELFEERAESVLVLLKQQFPGIPQSVLHVSKIQHNKDIGQAILESYSRILEGLAFKLVSRIDDVLEADLLAQRQVMGETDGLSETETDSGLSSDIEEHPDKPAMAETPNSRKLSDFIGWRLTSETKRHSSMSEIECYHDKPLYKSPKATPKKFSYLAKLENLRIPTERH